MYYDIVRVKEIQKNTLKIFGYRLKVYYFYFEIYINTA